jgi:predicted metalloprotease
MVWYMPVIPAIWEAEIGGSWFKASLSKKWENLSEKLTKAERTRGIAQVVEHKALSLNPSTAKKKRKERKLKH